MQLIGTITTETIMPLVEAALDMVRSKQGYHQRMVLDVLLIGMQERQNILDNEPHLASVLERMADRRVIEKGIQQLFPFDDIELQIITLYYFEGLSDNKIAKRINYTRPSINRKRPVAIEKLTEAIIKMERRARKQLAIAQDQTLPPLTYGEFIGRTTHVEQIHEALLADSKQLVAITGDGGLGKTTLAHYAIRQLIPKLRFEKLAWITIGSETTLQPEVGFNSFLQELIGQLDIPIEPELSSQETAVLVKQYLNEVACLVVLDNFELDRATHYFIVQLYQFVGYSRFLLTSRSRLTGLSQLALIKLSPFSAEEATQYLSELHTLETEQLEAIRQAVRGHPLALQLIIEQLQWRTVPEILAELDLGQSTSVLDMYTRLYRQKWLQISAMARKIVQALTLAFDFSMNRTRLIEVTQLPEQELMQPLLYLLNLSLITSVPVDEEIQFRIHPLLSSFVAQTRRDDAEATTVHQGLIANHIAAWAALTSKVVASQREFALRRAALVRALENGLLYAATAPAAVDLLLAMVGCVQTSGYVGDWLALLSRADETGWLSAEQTYSVRERKGWLMRIDRNLSGAVKEHHAVSLYAHQMEETGLVMRAAYHLGWDYCDLYQLDSAEKHARQTLELATELENAQLLLAAHDLLGTIALRRGDWTAADTALNTAHQLTASHPEQQARVLCNLILLAGEQNDAQAANAYHAQALDLIDQPTYTAIHKRIDWSLAMALVQCGAYDAAAQRLVTIEQNGQLKLPAAQGRATAAYYKGLIAYHQADWPTAVQALDASIPDWQAAQDTLMEVVATLYLARAQYQSNMKTTAHTTYQMAIPRLEPFAETIQAQRLYAMDWF